MAVPTLAGPQVTAGAHGVRPGDFRPDVEGMRAVAVLLVVIFHAGFSGLPGGFIGVDVFFVLSGFLITRLLVAEIHREGSIFLADFWARRARRLLPASTLTLVVVALASWLFVDPVQQAQTGSDTIAAAAFVANWWFAAQATDYFAADIAHSPLQHFWSLSVEEQYYMVWPPFLAVMVMLLARRRGWTVSRAVRPAVLVLTAVGTVSFLWSLYLTHAEPTAGYFSTLSRAWELAVGGLLALVLARGYQLPAGLAGPVGYGGIAAVVASAVLITEETPFPGSAALGPVLGTAAVLLAGAGGPGRRGVGRWLGVRPMMWIGRLSYSWYLWHWPFLILAPAAIGPLNAWTTPLVVLASLLAAQLTFRFVEDPMRRNRWLAAKARRSLALGGLLIAVGVGSGLLLGHTATGQETGIRPNPVLAAKDLSQAHADGCLTGFGGLVNKDCRYAEVGSAQKYVLIGDSHAVQWFPAAEESARRAGAELLVFGKSACMPVDVDLWSYKLDRAYDECGTWQRDAWERVGALPTGTVVLLAGWHDHYRAVDADGKRLDAAASDALISAGYARTVADLQDRGFVVVPIRDTPLPPDGNPAQCVAADPSAPQECDFPRPPASAGDSWEQRSLDAAGVPGEVLDLNSDICGQKTCPAVAEGILRWRDNNHISNTFSESLGPTFTDRLTAIVAQDSAG